MIPAITDGLRRLPVGDPFIDSLEHPILMKFYLAFLLAFVVGVNPAVPMVISVDKS